MRRLVLMTAVIGSLMGSLQPASAGEALHRWWDRMQTDFRRNVCWPEPFVRQDRAAVRAPWVVMEHNGWRAQNTMTGHLFDEDNSLTEAGRRKIFWIATQTPVQRRTVYVQTATKMEITEVRTEMVKEYVADLTANGFQAPAIVVTDREPIRWSGDYYNRMHVAGQAAIQAPVLPEMQLTTGQ